MDFVYKQFFCLPESGVKIKIFKSLHLSPPELKSKTEISKTSGLFYDPDEVDSSSNWNVVVKKLILLWFQLYHRE